MLDTAIRHAYPTSVRTVCGDSYDITSLYTVVRTLCCCTSPPPLSGNKYAKTFLVMTERLVC